LLGVVAPAGFEPTAYGLGNPIRALLSLEESPGRRQLSDPLEINRQMLPQ